MPRTRAEIEKDIDNRKMEIERATAFLTKYASSWDTENQKTFDFRAERIAMLNRLQQELKECIEEENRKEQKRRDELVAAEAAKKAAEQRSVAEAARKVAEQEAARRAAEEAARRSAEEAVKKAVEQKVAEEAAKKAETLKRLADMGFSIFRPLDFLQGILHKLETFDKSCKSIDSCADEAISNKKKEHSDVLSRMNQEKDHLNNEWSNAKTNKGRISSASNEKSIAFDKYKAKMEELTKRDEQHRNEVYSKMTQIKLSGNLSELENLRCEVFANKEEINNARDKIWQEYQSECAGILQSAESRQEQKNKEISQKRTEIIQMEEKINQKKAEQAKEFTAFLVATQADSKDKINAVIDKFKSIFDPKVVENECAEISSNEPFEYYKNQTITPKNVRIASLAYDLSTLNFGGHTTAFLGEYYPKLYNRGKLNLPYCITVSETNGLCFLQSKDNREDVYKTIQSFVLKLLLKVKTGLLKLTLYDGEGSGRNLIGLSHIDKRIKGENILTDQGELKRALEAAVADMNTTIQKVLGSKYADKTLMDYNEVAGKQAKPYHIICIADFPIGLGKDHLELITKIVRSGKQAGVFIVMYSDKDYVPKNSFDGMDVAPLLREMSIIKPDFSDKNQKLFLDSSFPDTDSLEQMQERISTELSEELKKGSKAEVKLSDDELWQSNSDSSNGIETPIGQLNVTDKQFFILSKEDGSSNIPHHCLIGGATGSGKTVLLHNIICNTAWIYSPDEVQFILLDYKEGTEFKVYENLPHAKVLSIHSEREYGISVLEYLNAEIERRGEKFKKVNAQNIAKYRESTGEKMPRMLVIIDEFQKLLDGDIRTSSFVSAAFDDIGRRGRSFGINLILSSQSLSGIDINQALSHLGLRIVLKLNSERDCDYFLAQGNHAPFKTLQKKGEAIYNARSGLPEGNERFQVAYLDPEKDIGPKISALREKSKKEYGSDKPFQRFIYDGNVSASIQNNKNIPEVYEPNSKCKVYIGEPVALEEEHSSYSLLSKNEYNILIVGQDILAALSILNHSIQQIIPQNPTECQVYICNTIQDEEHYNKLDALPKKFKNVKLLENDSEIQKTIETVFEEVEKRKTDSNKNKVILAFADIYNARNLRKSGYADSPLVQKLVAILKDGPGFGIHCIVHASSFANLKNVFDVSSMLNEFNIKIELRGGEGYRIFQSNEVGIEKSTPDNWNIANMQTSQMSGTRKIKVYGL